MTTDNLNRRTFLTLTGTALASLSMQSSFAAAQGAPRRATGAGGKGKRPNIVVILADDLSLPDTGAYGSTVLHTPHIDKLAREGTRFTRAFTTEAMCAPSRSSLYTGLYPVRNGCYMNHGAAKAGTKSLPHYLKPLGYKVALAGKRHIKPRQVFPFDYIEQDDVDEFLTKSKDEPFCLMIASNRPHAPHAKPHTYSNEDVEVPPQLVDTPETRATLAGYYTDVSRFDDEVGAVMASLEKHGLDESTLLICTSDHGGGLFAKWSCYDAGLHIPMIARWPGQVEAGRVTDAMVSFVDIVPTFVEVAGGKAPTAPEVVDGRSFLPVLRGQSDDLHDHVFGIHTNRGIIKGSTFPIRTIRTKTHQYILNLYPEGMAQNVISSGLNSWKEKAKTDEFAAQRVKWALHRPAEELYDLRTDPDEMNNLADDPAQRPLMDELKAQLLAWMEAQVDEGLATEMKVPVDHESQNAGGDD